MCNTSADILNPDISLQLRIALNMDTETYTDHCHCVIMKGGNIRGERSAH